MVLAVLRELEGLVAAADVILLVATGTYRGNTVAELESMLGVDLLIRGEVVNHDARDADSLAWCGTFGAGVPVWLNRRWVEADGRITTGFVEPVFFAGFSGGPKLVAPGRAALETVLTLSDAVGRLVRLRAATVRSTLLLDAETLLRRRRIIGY